jgi:hypothetical protein
LSQKARHHSTLIVTVEARAGLARVAELIFHWDTVEKKFRQVSIQCLVLSTILNPKDVLR